MVCQEIQNPTKHAEVWMLPALTGPQGLLVCGGPGPLQGQWSVCCTLAGTAVSCEMVTNGHLSVCTRPLELLPGCSVGAES